MGIIELVVSLVLVLGTVSNGVYRHIVRRHYFCLICDHVQRSVKITEEQRKQKNYSYKWLRDSMHYFVGWSIGKGPERRGQRTRFRSCKKRILAYSFFQYILARWKQDQDRKNMSIQQLMAIKKKATEKERNSQIHHNRRFLSCSLTDFLNISF